jgi:hypothetical protein
MFSPSVAILSQLGPFQALTSHLLMIHFVLSSNQRLVLPGVLFPSGFPTKALCAPLLSPIRTTCPAYLIVLDLITRIVLEWQYRSLSSSLCNFLHFPFTSSLLGPNTFITLHHQYALGDTNTHSFNKSQLGIKILCLTSPAHFSFPQ